MVSIGNGPGKTGRRGPAMIGLTWPATILAGATYIDENDGILSTGILHVLPMPSH